MKTVSSAILFVVHRRNREPFCTMPVALLSTTSFRNIDTIGGFLFKQAGHGGGSSVLRLPSDQAIFFTAPGR